MILSNMLPYFILDTIHIGPLTLHIWGLFAGLAFVAALYIALKEAKRKNISKETILDLAILILIGGVVGARLAFVAENWSDYSGNLAQIFKITEGGLMFYGGLAGALLAATAYVKFKKLAFWKIADALAPSLAIGEFVGRIGCSLADLHIGSITSLPWGQEYIDGSVRHPIGIYMALNGLVMFGVLWISRLRLKADGALFFFAGLWYSGTRFFLDFMRCDDLAVCDPRYFEFTPSQYVSAALFLSVLTILIINRKEDTYVFKSVALNVLRTARKNAIYSVSYIYNSLGLREKNMENEKDKNFSLEKQPDGGSSLIIESEEIIISKNTEEKPSFKLSGISKKQIALAAFVFGIILGAGLLYAYYGNFFNKSIFSFKGKTWVSYADPIVKLNVVSDKNCEECDVSDMVKQMKANAIPTLLVNEVNFDSAEAKALIAKFGIKSLPSLVFDSNVEKTEIFQQISQVLIKKDGDYYVNPAASGIPQTKLLEEPRAAEQDRVKGPADAPVTILEFSDFQCPYCKTASETVKQVLAAYPDKVKFIYRHFPLSAIHQDAQYAAEAAECAGDQGKFWEMSDVIFANQGKLSEADLNKYAKDLKLDMGEFGDCLHDGKFKAKVEADIKSANEYGIGGTPSFFVGDRFVSGGATLEDFKALIDEQLKNK
jgi:prolipoprotein diacylglyceryl transferase